VSPNERMARAIADCLEQHLEEYDIMLYRYPSGEIKGVEAEFLPGHSRISVYPQGVGSGLFEILVLTKRDPKAAA
jgi:hypothetical protein